MTSHVEMPMFFAPASGKRKSHHLSDDIDSPQCHRSNKRVRIDHLLLKLSLNGEKTKNVSPSKFTINPLVESYENPPKKPSLESYISGKMMDEYCSQYDKNLALWRCFLPRSLVFYHFQLWVRRLFNSFVRVYNERSHPRKPMKPFKSYFSVLWLVQDPTVQFTMDDLWHILRQQNLVEKEKIALKRDKRISDKRLEEIKDEQKLGEECDYQYWNRFSKLQRDIEMDETDTLELVLDTGMDLDPPMEDMPRSCHEANYGSYYATERW